MHQVKVNFITRGKIVEEYVAGASAIELAKKYGCSFNSVYNYIRAAKVPLRDRKKFDGELADAMRKEYEAGDTTTVIAERYNTHKSLVCSYIREAGGTIRTRGPGKKS